MSIDYSRLNPQQHEAVFHNGRRILCLAGAGTGKTQVLTHRIARLWEAGDATEEMLALTFTRAAGAEMKERVIGLIGQDGKDLFCNTFHAFCVEAIREHANTLGRDESFTIYDQREQEQLMAKVITDFKMKVTAATVWKVRADGTEEQHSAGRLHNDATQALAEYRYRLRSNNAFDFDGLIEGLTTLLQHEDIAAKYRAKYKDVFVDEHQDTDAKQWQIIQLLNPENLFVVGDDFQSIYGFRGSDISIILSLASDPGWHTVKLETNYRSTAPIIAAANSLIKHNKQTEKALVAVKGGPPVTLQPAHSDEDEIARLIPMCKANIENGITTAILARTNRQIQTARRILKQNGVPCEAASTETNPLNEPGGKRLLLWISAIANPQDEVSLKRLAELHMPLGEFLEVEKAQAENDTTLLDTMEDIGKGQHFIQALRDATATWNAELQSTGDIGAATIALANSRCGREADDAAMAIFAWADKQTDLGEASTANDLLNWVRFGSVGGKQEQERDADRIHIMTIHGSKGLEFDHVFIIQACQKTFSRGDTEEERRLFYVAITRAREQLFICCPSTDWCQFAYELGI